MPYKVIIIFLFSLAKKGEKKRGFREREREREKTQPKPWLF